MQSNLLTATMTAKERERLIEEIKIERELLKRDSYKSLASLCRFIWPIIEPTTPYKHNWHIDCISEHLAACRNFEIAKLIINMPPRSMKSLLVTVGFNVHVWLDNPEMRFIYAAYAQGLSDRDAMKVRDVLKHPLFIQAFQPKWQFKRDMDQVRLFGNDKTGYRFSTSIDGQLTGQGGDYLIADDPQNKMQMTSLAYRDTTYRFFEALATRANNPNKCARIVVQQRLHEDDVSGRLLRDQKGYEHLVLPMEFTPKPLSYEKQIALGVKEPDTEDNVPRSKTSLNPIDPRTQAGETLWDGRFDRKAVDDLKLELGDSSYAELNQDPKPGNGGLFDKSWWKYYEVAPSPILEIVQFWDCAQKPGVTNDYSVCATWARTHNGFYLLNLLREKTTGPVLEELAKSQYDLFKPNAVVIEDKSAGSSLIQYLLVNTTIPVIPFNPEGDKTVRATAATSTVKSGKCHLKKGADTNKEFINEHERFPKSAHDDQVDTTSMMVKFFQFRSNGPRVRSL